MTTTVPNSIAGGPEKRQLTPSEQQLLSHCKQSIGMLMDTQANVVEEGRAIPEELFDKYVEITKDTMRWLGGLD